MFCCFFPVGFKGNLSPLDIFSFFPGDLSKWRLAWQRAAVPIFNRQWWGFASGRPGQSPSRHGAALCTHGPGLFQGRSSSEAQPSCWHAAHLGCGGRGVLVFKSTCREVIYDAKSPCIASNKDWACRAIPVGRCCLLFGSLTAKQNRRLRALRKPCMRHCWGSF